MCIYYVCFCGKIRKKLLLFTELTSKKHAYIILTLLNPIYTENWGLQGYILFFLFLLSRNIKKYQSYLYENFQFLEMKFSIYLNNEKKHALSSYVDA